MSDYDLDFVKNYRPKAYALMQSFQRRLKHPKKLQEINEKIRKLEQQIAKCEQQANEIGCSHLIKDQYYCEFGHEDTLGNWKSGMDCLIRCNACNETLAEWHD